MPGNFVGNCTEGVLIRIPSARQQCRDVSAKSNDRQITAHLTVAFSLRLEPEG
jgi:hypothetical protein